MRTLWLMASLALDPSALAQALPDALVGHWHVASFTQPPDEPPDSTLLPVHELVAEPVALRVGADGTALVSLLVARPDGYERVDTPATLAVDAGTLRVALTDGEPDTTPLTVPMAWALDGETLVLRMAGATYRFARD